MKYITLKMFDRPSITKTITTFSIRLSKNTMLQILQHERIKINGIFYKVPEQMLLECLLSRKFGATILDLEEIE